MADRSNRRSRGRGSPRQLSGSAESRGKDRPRYHPADDRPAARLQQTDSAIIIAGRRPAEEMLRHAPERIREVLLAENAQFDPRMIANIESLQARGVRRSVSTVESLSERTGGLHHQGIALIVAPRPPVDLVSCTTRALKQGERAVVLILDQIQDPQNLGSILRVADAAGVSFVVLPEDHATAVTPAVRRASAGASEFLDVVRVKNIHRAILDLKESGFWIVGTAIASGVASLYATEVPGPVALVFGSEGRGMRELTQKSCDLLVALPMGGTIQSLNVNQAVSIVLYEIVRRRATI